jgi:D5 protein-like
LWVATAGMGRPDSKGNSAADDAGQKGRPASAFPWSSGGVSASACADGIAPTKRGKPIDPVKAFLKAYCSERKGAEATASDLHRAFQAWAAHQNRDQLSPKALGTRLSELGFERVKRGGVVRYRGVSLMLIT